MEKARWEISIDDAKTLGQTLRQIKFRKPEGSKFDDELWFQGDEKYFNIFIGIKKGHIEWVQMTFRGAYLEFHNGTLTTGTTTEYSGSATDGTPSKMLNRDRNINRSFILVAENVLSAPNEDILIKKCLERILEVQKN